MADFIDIKRDHLARYLRRHLEGEIRFDATSRKLYSTDASIYQIEPLGVVIPKSARDIATLIQIAGEVEVSLTARGGGTSLSGQSIGPGIVVDCSKYLNHILDVDEANRRARVQVGVVLDQLNRKLLPLGLQFGPEVATASRANLGGMIGNNSAGSRSIVYGKTSDHVRRLRCILADGSETDFGSVSGSEWARRAGLRTLEGTIHRRVREIVTANAEEIRRRFPKILRRVSGYSLDALCESLAQPSEGRIADLSKLVVGSEGTLAFVTEAEIDLVPRPKARGLLVAQFDSLSAAMAALASCLEFRPSAVELLDQMLLDLARENLSLRDTMATIRGRPAAVFMIEFCSDDPLEVADRVERLGQRLKGGSGIAALVPALDPALRDPLWNLRSASMPLLLGLPGDRKPITFVEDAAVAPEHLPEFVARFRELLQRHGTDGAFYGHASVGCLHIRPLLNLKDQEDVQRMRRITEEVTDLVLSFEGSLSGEHGDGLVRSEWNRKMFGPVVYEAFRQVKQAFDPTNLFNPGKVVNAQAMTENLRYGAGYHAEEPPTVFDYTRQEGFARSIELCNGAGVCRKMQGGTMCPSFRATRDEKDSTRGRANALRLAITGETPIEDLRSGWVHEVFDLCLMCKACKAECPSNVDVAKLKAEFLNFYYQKRARPLGHHLMARIRQINALGAPFAPIANWLQRQGIVRWALELAAGVDRRRSLPELHRNHFRRWFNRHKAAPAAGSRGRVLLLDDCFTTFQEPQIGRAAVRVLEHAGYAVELAGLICCGRPMLSKGMLSQARALAQYQVIDLARRVKGNMPILGLEPSCILSLADEWPELVPSPEARRVAQNAFLVEDWLARQLKEQGFSLELRAREETCVLHGHCHQKALVGVKGTQAGLRQVPGLDVQVIDAGCCGMAGSFGYEKEHFDVSVQIARLQLIPALDARPDALIVAPGTSCRHQIKDLTGRRARHPLEVLAEQLPGTTSDSVRSG